MKRIFTILCAALMTLSAVKAEVLLKESFGQATETLATNDNAFANEIAATGWTNINGSGQIYMNTTNLSYSGYKSTADTEGGSAEYKATFGKKAATPLSKSITSGSVYMAAIMDIKSYDGSSTTRDYIMAFGQGTKTLSTATNHVGRVYIRPGDVSGFQFAIAKGAETKTQVLKRTGDYAFGKYLVVVEYKFNSEIRNDEVSLYLNPIKGDKPAPTIVCVQDTAVTEGGTNVGASSIADAESIASALLYSPGSTKANIVIDELKVVTDWAELWESGGGTPTPTINVSSSSADFGTVNVGEPVTKDITVSGSNLTSPISVFTSKTAVTVSTPSISIAEAEAVGGYTLTLTLTPTAADDGTATVTLNSTDASDKVINVKWTGRKAISSIASFNLVDDYEDFALTSEPVVIRVESDYIAIQDASGALLLQNLYGSELAGIQVGDKLSGIIGLKSDADGYAETGLVTAFAVVAPQIKSSGNSADPLAVTLDNITKYGPALVKASGVSFAETGPFAAGNYTISQGSYSAKMRVPAGCDIIGQNIPESANVTGLVLNSFGNNYIQIRSKADVASGATGMDNVQSDKVQSTKVLRDGQLVIVKDGKMFNVIGVEL